MDKLKSLHLLLKYETTYKDTNIDTIEEHIKIDEKYGQVIWGVFTTKKSSKFDKNSKNRLDDQFNKGIPTFLFLYNKKTKSLYCADYIESYGRKEFPINSKELLPNYYHHLINKDFIKGEYTCQSYVKISNIRKIEFDYRNSIINEKSGVPLSEPSNSNSVFYVNILDTQLYDNLSAEFGGLVEDLDESITDEEVENSSSKKLNITVCEPPKKELNNELYILGQRKQKSNIKSFVDAHKNNEKLGMLGEKHIFEYELEKVSKYKEGIWLDRVKWISKEDKTSPYDIESVNEEGETVYIEVKTTKGKINTPFFASIYEMKFSKENSQYYRLYRLYDFNPKENKAKMYARYGSLYDACNFTPIEFKLL